VEFFYYARHLLDEAIRQAAEPKQIGSAKVELLRHKNSGVGSALQEPVVLGVFFAKKQVLVNTP
jgi:hypothetical protein